MGVQEEPASWILRPEHLSTRITGLISKVPGTQPGRHSRGISRESRKSPERGFPTKSLGNDDISAVPAIFAITSSNYPLNPAVRYEPAEIGGGFGQLL